MPHQPRISCIVPCLNAGNHLEAALDSLAAAAGAEDEIIAVYDRSSDATEQILNAFAPRVTTISRSSSAPRGAAAAINDGFKAATGDVFCWLGADDYVFPWSFDVVRRVFDHCPHVSWITSTQPCVIRHGVVGAGSFAGMSKDSFLDGFGVAGVRRGAVWMQQESTFWRRQLWEEAGGCLDLGRKFAFDLDLWARFFLHAPLHGVDSLLAAFRYRPGQLSANVVELAVEARQILAQARSRGGWRRDLLREALILCSHKRSRTVRNLALSLRPYTWEVARTDGDQWVTEERRFWTW